MRVFREEIFGAPTPPQPPEPQPMVAQPSEEPQPVEEPQPAVDAGTLPDEPVDAGVAAADVPVPEDPEPELRPGIVAFAEGQGVGSIRVVSKPRKARIYLDGVNTGKFTPYTLKNVPAGRRHVILAQRGPTTQFPAP